VVVPLPPDRHDVVVAFLSDLGYEAFLESEIDLRAYIPVVRDSQAFRDATSQAVQRVAGAHPLAFHVIPARNWNEEWERAAVPVVAGRFVILPGWSEASTSGKVPLWIARKMSFGTGHHESTRLALGFVEELVFQGASVLDAGTGTGILGIAAALLGAERVIAFDIDEWSASNCMENVRRNSVSDRIRFIHGDLSSVSESDFDLILANINRNTLLELLPDLSGRLNERGSIVLSGLLPGDRDQIIRSAERLDLVLADEASESEWWAASLVRARG
ncbi:MAG: 50S ribosomal protein L11 methyltransferase, partial [Rhodothermales bacterium]|nr:50S ribosomal protein L11 methyltransferase [Rhodothermales bacterium]